MRELFTLRNLPFIVLFLLFTLLPLFLFPSVFVSFEFSKVILIVLGVVTSLVLFLIILLKNGNLALPRHPIFIATGVLLLVYLISALVSGVKKVSLIGYGFETSTFMAILLFSILFFLVSVVFQSRKKFTAVYISFLAVSSLLALFHIIRFFFGVDFLSFGYFTSMISNTIGKWNELAVFFGASAILSVMSLAMLKLRPLLRSGVIISLLLSIFMVVVVNLTIVWYVLGAISLLLFIYLLSSQSTKLSTVNVIQSEEHETKMKTSGRTISVGALFIIIIAFVFALTPVGNDIALKINQKFSISNLEVRPSWGATYEIAKNTLKADPMFGIGPNRFGTSWQLYRPDVNLTNFWNVDFDNGIGFIPTTFVETGILGIIAWLLFFASFLFYGFRAFLKRSNDRLSQYFIASSFLISLYLWILAVFYMPSTPILALAFFFTGLSIASMYSNGGLESKSFSVFKYPRLNFLVATVIVLMLIASIGLGYIFTEKMLSFSYYQRGAALVSDKNSLDAAASYMLRAEGLSPNDVYYRSITELNIIRLNDIISATLSEKNVSEEKRNQFQSVFTSGLAAARRAQVWDPLNYKNWISVARIYETAIPAGAAEAADSSRAAYEEAAKRSPKNPEIYLSLGRLEAGANDLVKAKENVNKAISLKSNYLEAIFALSQLDAAQGNIQASANSIEKLIPSFPNDPNIYFRLGILRYQLKDYSGAAAAFEKAISVVPVYANARYFLGLSYQKINRVNDAIFQFEELAKTNPGNQEIESILSNLKAGKDPFAAVKAPLDNKPEKRKSLPVKETN